MKVTKIVYWVWKNPSCGGNNPDWQEINGREFYALVNSYENKGRYFVKLYKAGEDDADVVMESTKEKYVAWRKEKDHRDYLRKCEKASGYQAVSLQALESDDDCFGGKLFSRSEINDIEAECLKRLEREEVRAAVSRLNEEEQQIINYFYFYDKKVSERDYTEKTGITKSSVNRRKIAAFKKLRKFLSA